MTWAYILVFGLLGLLIPDLLLSALLKRVNVAIFSSLSMHLATAWTCSSFSAESLFYEIYMREGWEMKCVDMKGELTRRRGHRARPHAEDPMPAAAASTMWAWG